MTGQYAHNIDAKGRLFIPAALRRTEEAIQAALSEVQESRARFRATSQELMQEQRAQLNASASQPAKSGGEEGQR